MVRAPGKPMGKRVQRRVVVSRRAETLALECRRISGTMCQRDLLCCQGLETCSFTRRVSPNTTLFHSGDENQGFFQLLAGIVALTVMDENGNTCLVRLVEPGQVFGYRSLIAGQHHETTAVTLVPSEIWHVPARSARRAYQSDPHLQRVLHADLAANLSSVRRDMLMLATGNVHLRLWRFFRELGRLVGIRQPGGEVTVPLPLTYAEIATLLGHTPESVSRALRRLASQGCLAFHRYSVVLLSPGPDDCKDDDQGDRAA